METNKATKLAPESDAERNVRILKNRATAANQAAQDSAARFERGEVTEEENDAADRAYGEALKAWREANLALVSA